MKTKEQLQENKQYLEAVRKGLYGEDGSIDVVASCMSNGDNERFDTYQCVKMLKVVMVQLYDLSERLKKLEVKK